MLSKDIYALFLAGDMYTKGDVGEPFKYVMPVQKFEYIELWNMMLYGKNCVKNFREATSLDDIVKQESWTVRVNKNLDDDYHKCYFICSVKNDIGKKFAVVLRDRYRATDINTEYYACLTMFDDLKLTPRVGGVTSLLSHLARLLLPSLKVATC